MMLATKEEIEVAKAYYTELDSLHKIMAAEEKREEKKTKRQQKNLEKKRKQAEGKVFDYAMEAWRESGGEIKIMHIELRNIAYEITGP